VKTNVKKYSQGEKLPLETKQYERIVLRWIFRKWGGGCGDWIQLAQNRERWRALVSTVMKLRVPKMRGIP